MKKLLFYLIFSHFIGIFCFGQSQNIKPVFLYTHLNFQLNNTENSRLRLSAIPNFSIPVGFEIGRNRILEFNSGILINNVGIRFKNPTDTVFVFRGLTVGVPLELKIFNSSNNHFRVGVGYEYIVNGKQKILINGKKYIDKNIDKKIFLRHQVWSSIGYVHKNIIFTFRYYINNLIDPNYYRLNGNKSNVFNFSVNLPVITGFGLNIGK